MTRALSWLRAELAADRERLAAMSLTDYAKSAVDTLLAPGLYLRSTIHACVYAINHGRTGATTTVSLFEPPLQAAWWRPSDRLQARALSWVALGAAATPFVSLPGDPALAAYVSLQALPLACDPLATVTEVVG